MIDERKCPNCGHAVLSWDVCCPGCDTVPYQTRKGRKALKRQRNRKPWVLPLLILFIGGLVWLAWYSNDLFQQHLGAPPPSGGYHR